MSTAHDPTTIRVHLRWMIRHDLPAVVAIGRHEADRPMTEVEMLRMLSLHRGLTNVGYVAEHGDRVVGYMVYALDWPTQRIRLLELAVDPRHRRRGVGSALVTRLVSKLGPYRYSRASTFVRETNLGAQLFLRGRGWLARETLAGAFHDTGEDAYLMAYDWQGEGR